MRELLLLVWRVPLRMRTSIFDDLYLKSDQKVVRLYDLTGSYTPDPVWSCTDLKNVM